MGWGRRGRPVPFPTVAATGSRDTTRRPRRARAAEIEVSVVLPCLNEAETLASCIRRAQAAASEHGISAEIVVADNGSTDGSQRIAIDLGARVVPVTARGYGNALLGGIRASRGRYVLMGDSDDSYDFGLLHLFVAELRAGYDLVMGNRFRGRIEKGAMPTLNRYLGNPVLTGIGRLFYGASAGDFHCGMRAFTREAFDRLLLRSQGMEFASEMVIKATLQGMRIGEVPIVLRKDGRSRPPHLRPWRDGWRHLRFMLLFSPRWLFLFPGAAMFGVGALLSALLVRGPLQIGRVGLDVHSLLVGGFLMLVGYQVVVFAVFTKVFAVREGLHPPHKQLTGLFRYVNLEVGLIAGALLAVGGFIPLAAAAWHWETVGFGALEVRDTMRLVIPAVVSMTLGVQTIFASFFLSILGIGRDGRPVGSA